MGGRVSQRQNSNTAASNAHYLRLPAYLHALQADPPRDTYIDPDTGYSVFTQVSE
jgi:hypothetical protein